jgi:prenylcysteine alpha-carboxyl methylesterase
LYIIHKCELLFKLTKLLLSFLLPSLMWIIQLTYLLIFIFTLFPAFVRNAYWYATTSDRKEARYGPNPRNFLDVYSTEDKWQHCGNGKGNGNGDEGSKPVVVFLSGGAWIIGYKAWGSLLARNLAKMGIVVVTPDYRNFPQGIIVDMTQDISSAMTWIEENISKFGGDKNKIHLVGQSAGAHLAVLVALQQILKRQDGRPSSLWSNLSSIIAISGPYDLHFAAKHMVKRGLSRGIIESVMVSIS